MAPRKKAAAAKKPAAGKKPAGSKSATGKEIIALMDKMGDEARGKMKEAIDRSQEQKPAKGAAAKKAAAGKKTGDAPADAYIDQNGPASFFIGARGKRIFFTREEMRNLTRISHGAEDALAGARRIFTWMERERQDFLTDTGISQPGDRSLQRIWEIIVTSYKVS